MKLILQVIAHKYDTKLGMQKSGESFKPGMRYDVIVALKQQDETPVKANVPKRVQCTVSYVYPFTPLDPTRPEDKSTMIIDLETDGTKLLSFIPPLDCTRAEIEVLDNIYYLIRYILTYFSACTTMRERITSQAVRLAQNCSWRRARVPQATTSN